MTSTRLTVTSLAALVGLAGAAFADINITGTIAAPSIDRWMYPFAGTPGSETAVPIFAAIGQPGFDDRDSQFLLKFDTASLVTAGLGDGKYLLESLTVRIFVANPPRFEYDPTFDSFRSSLDPLNPLFEADADVGKPVEMFAAGFRGGWSTQTYTENSPFANQPVLPPTESIRNVFTAALDADSTPTTDISNHLKQEFEAPPLAVATTDSVAPGELVPTGAQLALTIDVSDPNARCYFERALDQGAVWVVVSSLHPASGGPGGGTGDPTYPSLFTKENAAAVAENLQAKLDVQLTITEPLDFNNDGVFPDSADLFLFLDVFGGAPCAPCACSSIDVNNDGVFPDIADLLEFIRIFGGGN